MDRHWQSGVGGGCGSCGGPWPCISKELEKIETKLEYMRIHHALYCHCNLPVDRVVGPPGERR